MDGFFHQAGWTSGRGRTGRYRKTRSARRSFCHKTGEEVIAVYLILLRGNGRCVLCMDLDWEERV